MKIDDQDRMRKLRGAFIGLIVIALLMTIILVILPHRFGWQDVEIMFIAAVIGALVYFGSVLLEKRSRSGA